MLLIYFLLCFEIVLDWLLLKSRENFLFNRLHRSRHSSLNLRGSIPKVLIPQTNCIRSLWQVKVDLQCQRQNPILQQLSMSHLHQVFWLWSWGCYLYQPVCNMWNLQINIEMIGEGEINQLITGLFSEILLNFTL